MARQFLTGVGVFVIGLVVAAGSLVAHEGHEHGRKEKPAPNFSFDPGDERVDASMIDGSLFYDGDVAHHNGALWYAWLEFVPGEGDLVWIGRRQGDGWATRKQITASHGEYAAPTLTSDLQGRLWLTYEARTGDGWSVFAVEWKDGQAAPVVQRVSSGSGANIHHDAAATVDGPWVVWQTDRGGQFDVVGRRLGTELGEIQDIGTGSAGDWHPRVTADSQGTVHVAWDSYENGTFDVFLRSRRDGRWGDVVSVAQSAAFEGRVALATDRQDRVWIAWEEDGDNWGKPFRGNVIQDHSGPLHRYRLIRLAVMERDGRLSRFDDRLPMPSVDAALARHGSAGRTGAFYERCELAVDGAGRPWLAYRHYYTPWLTVMDRHHVEEGWAVYARCYTADGWSPLMQMSIGQGDGLQRLELSPQSDGIAAVWTTGRTDRRTNARPRGLATASFTTDGAAPRVLPLREPESSVRDNSSPPEERRESVTVGGKTYHLFYGDLHRHTDLSLCRVPIDGTIDDAYRYAIEVAKLDFLGITDHSRDIAQGDPLSQLWWRSRKEVYRHQLVDGAAMKFIPFFAYERSHSHTADHNVISLRGDVLRPPSYPFSVFLKELDHDTLTIPHQPIRRDTWIHQDDRLRPLVEIFQGCRNRSIEDDVHRGLGLGYHLGFIASSDHRSTSASYACVWAEEPTRESVFRAMQARRTFAATDKIWLTLRAGEHWMGEILPAATTAPLVLRARGTAVFETVRLVVDGKVRKTWRPNAAEVELEVPFEMDEAQYAYFHLVQRDGNEAWSSPIWFDQDDASK